MHGLVLTAAGSSTRFGAGPSKVLKTLRGVPVLLRALEPFREAIEDLSVVVTVRAGDREALADLTVSNPALRGVRVIEGGATRQKSVARGVAALPRDLDVILVHDAARPLVTADVVRRVVAAATKYGAAAPGIAVADSLHRVDSDGKFATAVPREGLRAVQTPQAARADLLRRALAEAARHGREATDEVGLLLAAEVPVTAVEGDAENVKITTLEDWTAAEAILDRRGASLG